MEMCRRSHEACYGQEFRTRQVSLKFLNWLCMFMQVDSAVSGRNTRGHARTDEVSVNSEQPF